MISNHAPSTTRPSLQIDYFCGGEGGSRTHVGLAPKPDFESGAFGHSATSPLAGGSFITARAPRRQATATSQPAHGEMTHSDDSLATDETIACWPGTLGSPTRR